MLRGHGMARTGRATTRSRGRGGLSLQSFCPDYPSCKGSAGRVPVPLSDNEKANIDREISDRGLEQLPNLEPGEDFYRCSYCFAVWKARSLKSSPTARVLGEYWGISGRGWQPRTSNVPRLNPLKPLTAPTEILA